MTEFFESALPVLQWLLVGFAALWLVSAVVSHFHRRAYNLTRAESAPSKNIKPDFLTVDRIKREAAIERGRAYDTKLAAREAPAPVSPAEKMSLFSRVSAGIAAIATLLTTILATFGRVEALEKEADRFGRFMEIVSENKVGALVALLVIAANVLVFVETSKKWRKSPAQAK